MSVKKTSKGTKQKTSRTSASKEARTNIQTIQNVRDVNIAHRDIITQITRVYQQTLTRGEVVEKEWKIEVNALRHGIQVYLNGLKEQLRPGNGFLPYKKLEQFTLRDAGLFFGRDDFVAALYEAMERGRLTVLQAESGAGKTSLLQAGIIPLVMKKKQFAILIRSQFSNPSHTLKRCFLEDLSLTPKLAQMPLLGFLRRVSDIIGQETTLYLILDQFEEFFAKQTNEQDRQDFIRELSECIHDANLNVRWVISITSNAFGQLGKFEPYIRTPFSNAKSLYLFTRQEAEDVLLKTASVHGLSLEDGLLNTLLDDLGNEKNEPIAPTQMQLVFASLYEGLNEDTCFTSDLYQKKGRVKGILHDYVGNVLREKLPFEERPIAYKILEALVTSEKKRVLRGKQELEVHLTNKGIGTSAVDSTLEHLVNQRLLRRIGEEPQHVQFEIVHDYLLQEIEIDPAVVRYKQAEELLDDGLKAWQRNRAFLFTREHLMFIGQQYDQQAWTLQPDALELLVLSAAVNDSGLIPWSGLLSVEKLREITLHVVEDLKADDPVVRKKSKRIAWSLREYLPASVYRNLKVERLLRRSWFVVPVLAVLLLIYFPIKNWLSVPIPSGWEELSSFDMQTHTNLTNLSIAIDVNDPDDVLVSGQAAGQLWFSADGGTSWDLRSTQGMNEAIRQLSSMVGQSVYGLTDDAVWFSHDRGLHWEKTGSMGLSGSEELLSIAVNPRDAAEVFVGGDHGTVVHSTDSGRTWSPLGQVGYTGLHVRALTTNGKILVISTEEGLWMYRIETGAWSAIHLIGCSDVQGEDLSDRVDALVMPYPLNDPPDGITTIGIWAAISGIGICDADTENLYPTTRMYRDTLHSISSITATGDVQVDQYAFLGTSNGIVRYRTWFAHDLEWWKIRFRSFQS